MPHFRCIILSFPERLMNAGKCWAVRGCFTMTMRIEYQLNSDDLIEVSREQAVFRPWIFIWFAGMIVCFALAGSLLPSPQQPVSPPVASPSASLSDVVLPFLPWLAILIVIWVKWDAQPHLHRPHVLEADQSELRLSEPLSGHRYRWEYFPGWSETANVFVIYLSVYSFHIIPKRAFADDAQRAEFVALLRRMISERTNAFPVIPADVRPLPPLPVAG